MHGRYHTQLTQYHRVEFSHVGCHTLRCSFECTLPSIQQIIYPQSDVPRDHQCDTQQKLIYMNGFSIALAFFYEKHNAEKSAVAEDNQRPIMKAFVEGGRLTDSYCQQSFTSSQNDMSCISIGGLKSQQWELQNNCHGQVALKLCISKVSLTTSTMSHRTRRV